ncbi:hypothetical protein TYRP_017284 [Tyrophagus putrescentiae]|nr:hypothetical protein TYRP_017284 [Tyrophagus putrescentiae]
MAGWSRTRTTYWSGGKWKKWLFSKAVRSADGLNLVQVEYMGMHTGSTGLGEAFGDGVHSQVWARVKGDQGGVGQRGNRSQNGHSGRAAAVAHIDHVLFIAPYYSFSSFSTLIHSLIIIATVVSFSSVGHDCLIRIMGVIVGNNSSVAATTTTFISFFIALDVLLVAVIVLLDGLDAFDAFIVLNDDIIAK